MDILKLIRKIKLFAISLILLFGSTGCQFQYIIKSGAGQAKLISRKIPIEEALRLEHIDQNSKRKLRLAQEVVTFLENDLKLPTEGNYKTYVQLDGPYVTYAVIASESTALKQYTWKFPIVGSVPYLGFFEEEDARKEEQKLKSQGYDTFVRGISAYSTLGWFKDPILSSMLRYEEEDLVNTLIHETIHAHLFIKNEADFNEQLATFLGNIGTRAFYEKKENLNSPIFQKIKNDLEDDKLFSDFISQELVELEKWYANTPIDEVKKAKHNRLKQIQVNFKNNIEKKLKGKAYLKFAEMDLNNAKLLSFKTYFYDLSKFEKKFNELGSDFEKFFSFCKALESNPDELKKHFL